MRIFTAFALYVCLYNNLLPAEAITAKPTWDAVHQQGRTAYEQHDYQQSEKIFRESLILAATNVQRGIATNDIAHSIHNQAREKEAIDWFNKALAIWEKLPGYQDCAAHAANGLADALRGLGDYDAADKAHERALQFKHVKSDTRAEMLNAYADLLREQGHFDSSRTLFEESLKLEGVSERRTLDALLGVGDLARHYGEWNKSVDTLRRASVLAEEQHYTLPQAVAIRGMAQTYMEQGLLSRAEPLLRQSMNLLESSKAPPQQIAMTMACTGDLYRMEGKLALAEDAWTKTIALETPALGENHPQVAMIMQQLAELYATQQRPELAQDYATRSYDIMRGTMGDDSPAAATALASLASIEAQNNHLGDSALHFEKSLGMLKKSTLARDNVTATVLKRYAVVLKALHRNGEAKMALRDAKAILQ